MFGVGAHARSFPGGQRAIVRRMPLCSASTPNNDGRERLLATAGRREQVAGRGFRCKRRASHLAPRSRDPVHRVSSGVVAGRLKFDGSWAGGVRVLRISPGYIIRGTMPGGVGIRCAMWPWNVAASACEETKPRSFQPENYAKHHRWPLLPPATRACLRGGMELRIVARSERPGTWVDEAELRSFCRLSLGFLPLAGAATTRHHEFGSNVVSVSKQWSTPKFPCKFPPEQRPKTARSPQHYSALHVTYCTYLSRP